MTKQEIVDDISKTNADLVLAFLSATYPVFNIGIVRYLAKHYLAKWLRPMVNEGTVFIAFQVFDRQQMNKAEEYGRNRERLLIALESGVPDAKSSIDFDNSFRDAIRLKP